MNIDQNTASAAIGGIVTALGALYGATRHAIARSRRKKEEYRQGILKEANDSMTKIKAELEEKIKSVESEIQAQKLNVSIEFSHFKETHNAEIKVLGEKIESLRQDLHDQHQALVSLLTKLVESKQ